MTRDRMDLLFQHAADLGVDVEWADLGDVLRGEYRDDRRLIVLNNRLTRNQAIACCAHEVAHAIFGDRCSTPRVERRADEYGASLVIDRDEYMAAEEEVGEHAGALAVVLEVTPRMVLAWRRWAYRRAIV